jgi:hypothetical protein
MCCQLKRINPVILILIADEFLDCNILTIYLLFGGL